MKRTTKLSAIFISVLVCLTAFAAALGLSQKADATNKSVFTKVPQYFSHYAVGEKINIFAASAQQNSKDLETFAALQKGSKVLCVLPYKTSKTSFTFTQPGSYNLVYSAKGEDKIYTKNFIFTVSEGNYINADLDAEYFLGSKIAVAADAVVGGNFYPTSVEVADAGGKTLPVTDGFFTPSKPGVYTVSYSFDANDISVERVYKINIKKIETPSQLFLAEQGIVGMENNVEAPGYAVPGGGVAITSDMRSSSFQYVNLVDLNKLSPDVNLISLLPLGESGYDALSAVYIDLIDAHNPLEKISYYLYSKFYGPSATPSPSGDTREWSYMYINYKGRDIKRHTFTSGYGISIQGVSLNPALLKQEQYNGKYYGKAEWLDIRVNYAEKQFFSNAYTGKLYESKQMCVLDADDPADVGNDMWDGFTTGEIIIKVRVETNGSSAGILVREVAGVSLSGETLTDTTAPFVYLEDSYMQQLPNAVVGKEYTVPNVVRSLDAVDGELLNPDFTVKLYKKINDNYSVDMGEVGKTFTPQEWGEFYIEYSVLDAAANKGSLKVPITVFPDMEEISFETGFDTPPTLGKRILLPRYNIKGMSYIVKRDISIIYCGEDISDLVGKQFLPEINEELIYRYDLKDFLGNKLKGEKRVAFVVDSKPVINISQDISEYVFANVETVLPNFTAINYSKSVDSMERTPPRSITVNGRSVDLESRTFTPHEAEETIKVVYKAGDTREEYSIKIKKVEYISDRFYTESAQGEAVLSDTANGVRLNFNFDTELKTYFPVAMPDGQGFSIDFSAPRQSSKYSSFDMVFKDAVHAEKSFFLRFAYNQELLQCRYNGQGKAYVVRPVTEGANDYQIVYQSHSKIFVDLFGVKTLASGEDFNGFSGHVKVSVRFNEVVGESSFLLTTLGIAKLQSTIVDGKPQGFVDYTRPQVIFHSDIYANKIAYNQSFTIPAAYALSNYSGFIALNFTLFAPDGSKLAENINGYDEYVFTPTEYGAYRIEYYAKRGDGKVMTVGRYGLMVDKTQEHKIVLSQEIKERYKEGESLIIPEVTVIDSIGEVSNTILYTSAEGVIKVVKSGDTVVFAGEGTAYISVLSRDSYNSIITVIKVVIEKA